MPDPDETMRVRTQYDQSTYFFPSLQLNARCADLGTDGDMLMLHGRFAHRAALALAADAMPTGE